MFAMRAGGVGTASILCVYDHQRKNYGKGPTRKSFKYAVVRTGWCMSKCHISCQIVTHHFGCGFMRKRKPGTENVKLITMFCGNCLVSHFQLFSNNNNKKETLATERKNSIEDASYGCMANFALGSQVPS